MDTATDNKTKNQNMPSIILTIAILLIIIASGPISAVRITLGSSPEPIIEGQTLSFTVNINFETDEIIPIENITVLINDTISGMGTAVTSTCTFDISGNPLSGNCTGPSMNITHIQNSYNMGYGYSYASTRYGYDYTAPNPGDRTNYSFGYGYGYGYDLINMIGTISYTISWTAPPISTNTSYDIFTKVDTGQSHSFEYLSEDYIYVINNPNEIDSCAIINTSGDYYMSNNITLNNAISTACIDIQADNVVFDCNNYGIIVNSSGYYDGYGIIVNRSVPVWTNITVRNCEINNWLYGIKTINASNNSLENLNIIDTGAGISTTNGSKSNIKNTSIQAGIIGIVLIEGSNNNIENVNISDIQIYYGLGLYDTSNNNIDNLIISQTNLASYIHKGTNNTITDSQFINNTFGLGLSSFSIGETSLSIDNNGNITVTNSSFIGNDYGLLIGEWAGKSIYNNFFNNTVNVYIDGSAGTTWNTTETAGNNIIDGNIIGGNYWGFPNGTGFSDTCSDIDNNGICDNIYQINENYTDYLPLTYGNYDSDGDGVADNTDTLYGFETNVTTEGLTNLTITVGGNNLSEILTDKQEVTFYENSINILNFSHNFSLSNLDLTKITIKKTSNSIIVNLSGQLQDSETKTIFINDNNFASLCAKDTEVSSISEVSSTCTGDNETDFTSCLGNSTGTTINGITCYDNGNIIQIENLSHSAVIGVPEEDNDDNNDNSGSTGSISSYTYSPPVIGKTTHNLNNYLDSYISATIEVSVGDILNYQIENSIYNLTITGIDNNNKILHISNIYSTHTVNMDTYTEIDIDQNRIYDLSIYLREINSQKATIFIKKYTYPSQTKPPLRNEFTTKGETDNKFTTPKIPYIPKETEYKKGTLFGYSYMEIALCIVVLIGLITGMLILNIFYKNKQKKEIQQTPQEINREQIEIERNLLIQRLNEFDKMMPVDNRDILNAYETLRNDIKKFEERVNSNQSDQT